jgi:tRNA threonylcarbamoyl adenosine modification protein YeaZ
VAVHDGDQVLAAVTRVDARRHGELLAPAIVEVLEMAHIDRGDLTRVAVGVGPGPFTGLRVGLVTARTLGMALDVPVDGVCTLDVIAAGVPGPAAFAVATDARRREVYWARYERAGIARRRVEGPAVSRPPELLTRLGHGEPVFGRGGELHADVLPYITGPLDPDAAVMADRVARGRVELLPPDPLYLRRPDVSVPGRPKPVS